MLGITGRSQSPCTGPTADHAAGQQPRGYSEGWARSPHPHRVSDPEQAHALQMKR